MEEKVCSDGYDFEPAISHAMPCPFVSKRLKLTPGSSTTGDEVPAAKCPFTGATNAAVEQWVACVLHAALLSLQTNNRATLDSKAVSHAPEPPKTCDPSPSGDSAQHAAAGQEVAPSCPFGFSSSSNEAGLSSNQGSERAAVCPYGYGSGSEPALTPLQCSLCRTYLHACTSLQPCGHRFCRCGDG